MKIILVAFVWFSAIALPVLSQRRCKNSQFECSNGQCIPKSNWCRSNVHPVCSDNSHKSYCGTYNSCYQNQKLCTNDKKCIPIKWFCDGYQDCDDGSDERNCREHYRIPNIPGVTNSRQRAVNWLIKQRRVNWGWEGDTSRAIVSLFLANTKQFHPGDSSSQLMVKQMEIQLSKILLTNGSNSSPAHHLALYIHALLATCINPRNFQGYNLVETLKQRVDRSDSFNPFLALVLCNANETLSSKHILKLIEVMNRPSKPEWTDSQAFAAMALICVKQRIKNNFSPGAVSFDNDTIIMHDLPYHIRIVIPINHTYSININNITSVFKHLQQINGSFGSIYTTALALQALVAAESPEDGWEIKKAIQYLMSEQRTDGSFGNILSTYLILPLLYTRTFLELGNVSCTGVGSNIRNITVKEELDSIRSAKQTVHYSVWLGVHNDVSFSMSLTIPVNRTFYDVMRLAQELDPRYRFEYFPYSWGKYVYSIFGVANDPESRMYWQLYHVEEEKATFIDKAPDKLIPEKNGRYAYWYRPTNHV